MIEAGEKDVDQDQKIALIRWMSNSQIMVMPKTDPRAEKEYAIV